MRTKIPQRSVLIVEDEPVIMADVAMALEEEDWVPILATDVPSAQQLLDHVTPDAAILDIDVGGKDILPVVERLQSMGVAVVFHSGQTALAEVQTRFPGCLFVSKPSSARDLIQAVESA